MHDELIPCIMESKVTSLIAAHSLLSQFTRVTVTALVESMLCCLPLEEFDLQYMSFIVYISMLNIRRYRALDNTIANIRYFQYYKIFS